MSRHQRALTTFLLIFVVSLLAACGGGNCSSGASFGGTSGTGGTSGAWSGTSNGCGANGGGGGGGTDPLGRPQQVVYTLAANMAFEKYGVYASSIQPMSFIRTGALPSGNWANAGVVQVNNKYIYYHVAAQDALTGELDSRMYGYYADRTTDGWGPIPGSQITLPTSGKLVRDPLNRFIFVAGQDGSRFTSMTVLRVDQQTGALSIVPGSPFPLDTEYASSFTILRNGTLLYVHSSYEGALRLFRIGDDGSITPTLVGPWASEVTELKGGTFNNVDMLFGLILKGQNEPQQVKTVFSWFVDAVGNPSPIPLETAVSGTPKGLEVHPTGKFVYVDTWEFKIDGFRVGLLADLTPLAGSPFDVRPDFGRASSTYAWSPSGTRVFTSTPGFVDFRYLDVNTSSGSLTGNDLFGGRDSFDVAIIE